MGTFSIKEKEIKRDWYIVDAANQTLGRLATSIAHHLKGKHKPEFTPHLDVGDYIVVINAANIRVTGNKMTDKVYRHYSGYQSGLKEITLEKLLIKAPERVIENAVKGMLPKGPLGRQIFSKLKVYAGATHPHVAQQLKVLVVGEK